MLTITPGMRLPRQNVRAFKEKSMDKEFAWTYRLFTLYHYVSQLRGLYKSSCTLSVLRGGHDVQSRDDEVLDKDIVFGKDEISCDVPHFPVLLSSPVKCQL